MKEEATKKQLWALYCLTKKDYRNSGLSKEEASNLLSELIGDKETKKDKPVKAQISLKEELIQYLNSNISKIVEAANDSLKIESVIENDPMYMKEKKRYAFVGFGCAFVWIEFDKRSKKAKEIYQIARQIRYDYSVTFEKQFDKKVVEYYNNIGCPLQALFQQDENIQNAYFWLITEFMKYKGVKNAYVMSRLD